MKKMLLALIIATSSTQANARTGFIDAFAESNYGQCVEFQFEGGAFYSKLSFSLFSGVAITFYVSPITAHYNPDFLVTAYSRLGESPLFESYIALGHGQNIVAKPLVEFLTRQEVPKTWYATDEWSGQGTDQKRESHSTLQYFESEVFGHPGNVYTWASQAFRGELAVGLPGASLLTALPSDIAKTPAHVAEVVQSLADNANTQLGGDFTAEASARFDPVSVATNAVVGELNALAGGTTLGEALEELQPLNLSATHPAAVYTNFLSGQMIETSAGTTTAIPGHTPSTLPPPDPDAALPRIDFDGLTPAAVDELRARFSELTPEQILSQATREVGAATEKIDEVVTLFRTLNEGALADYQGLFTPGVGFEPIGFQGFCPSDTQPFLPYYMSGTNVLSWRFKLPELVYPQTYLPFSNQTTIGELFPGQNTNPVDALGQAQNYGSVYPRNGYLLQADPVKAAAAAAFRSAHVVTRPGQPHIYRSAPALSNSRYTMFDHGYETLDWNSRSRESDSVYLQPDQDETGRWQLIHSDGVEPEQSCHRFGSPEVNPELASAPQPRTIGGTLTRFPVQWSEDKVSESNDYMFNLWRRYRCAPKPQGSFVTHLGNFTLPSPVTIID